MLAAVQSRRPLLEMPQLERVAIIEYDVPDESRGVRQMCIDLKNRRPELTVLFNRTEVSASA